MGKKSVIASPAPRKPIVRTEDRIGGDAHLSFKVLPLKRHLNRFAQGGEGAAVYVAYILNAVGERWLANAGEMSADPGHIKGEAALVRAVHEDPFLSPLLSEVVGTRNTLPEDDEVVTKHIDSVNAKRAAKRAAKKDDAQDDEKEEGGGPAPMDEDNEDGEAAAPAAVRVEEEEEDQAD